MFDVPRPNDVIDNLDAIKEWLIFAGLILAVAIGVWTLTGMVIKAVKKWLHLRSED